MKKTHIALAATLLAMNAWCAVPKGGKQISPNLIGIFFEDISYSADGGLYSELVENGSFEYSPTEHSGWGPSTAWRMKCHGHSTGYIQPISAIGQKSIGESLNENNPTFMRICVERIGHYSDFKGWTGVALENNGFDSLVVKSGEMYRFSAFLKSDQKMPVRVVLTSGKNQILADHTIEATEAGWKKYTFLMTASDDSRRAHLQVIAMGKGTLDVDMVSLMPDDTYKGHGMRRDLAEALEGLSPRFVRFPGGCIVHGGGDGFWDTYRWKNTVGPKEQRKGLKNCWGYHQSFGLGYYEYFQLCEDLKAEPLPILPVGVSCQGAGGGWGLKEQAQDVVPLDQMDEWVQDALDLIEWANGDASTKWGKVRAEAGHPKPFNLKYLGLGNEERISPEFCERFKIVYNAVRKAHPEITIVGTAGPGSHTGNSDYENGWKLAEEVGLPIIDEHYYEKRDYFLDNQQNYDKYPRNRKTKVYLGEYAAKDKKLKDALYEALYLIGIERNGDVVAITSYAPLFAKKGHTSWNPDLIYFDNERVIRTCSYYVQQMFGQNSGDYYYGDVVKVKDGDKYQAASCILNSKKNEVYVKIVNAGTEQKTATVNLSAFSTLPKTATLTTLSGDLDAENNFESQPVIPVAQSVDLSKKFTLDLTPATMYVIKVKLQ